MYPFLRRLICINCVIKKAYVLHFVRVVSRYWATVRAVSQLAAAYLNGHSVNHASRLTQSMAQCRYLWKLNGCYWLYIVYVKWIRLLPLSS